MNNFWDTNQTAKPLTLADLDKAIEAIKNAPPHPCRLGKHVVSAEALRTPGWYRCGNCGGPVEVREKS